MDRGGRRLTSPRLGLPTTHVTLSPSISSRGLAKYVLDVAVWTALTPIAFALRLEGDVFRYPEALIALTLGGALLKVIAEGLFRLPRRAWRWIGIPDLMIVLTAVGIVTLAMFVGVVAVHPVFPIPRSVPLIEGTLAIVALGGMRLAMRVWHEGRGRRRIKDEGRRVVVVGAGNAGAMVVREMLRHPESHMIPVGFLDDDRAKQKLRIASRPVLGTLADLESVVRLHAIEEVLIAIPSARGDTVRRVVTAARKVGREEPDAPAALRPRQRAGRDVADPRGGPGRPPPARRGTPGVGADRGLRPRPLRARHGRRRVHRVGDRAADRAVRALSDRPPRARRAQRLPHRPRGGAAGGPT